MGRSALSLCRTKTAGPRATGLTAGAQSPHGRRLLVGHLVRNASTVAESSARQGRAPTPLVLARAPRAASWPEGGASRGSRVWGHPASPHMRSSSTWESGWGCGGPHPHLPVPRSQGLGELLGIHVNLFPLSLSVSLCPSLPFSLSISLSVSLCPSLSLTLCLSLFLSFSVPLSPFLSPSISLCPSLSASLPLSFPLFLSPSESLSLAMFHSLLLLQFPFSDVCLQASVQPSPSLCASRLLCLLLPLFLPLQPPSLSQGPPYRAALLEFESVPQPDPWELTYPSSGKVKRGS